MAQLRWAKLPSADSGNQATLDLGVLIRKWRLEMAAMQFRDKALREGSEDRVVRVGAGLAVDRAVVAAVVGGGLRADRRASARYGARSE